MSSRRSISNSLRPCVLSRDHLSNLHESILCHILSRLPTEDAIRTSVLSKNWNYKWTCMYHIDISDYFSGVLSDNESFGNFVYNVVSYAQNLKSFGFSCRGDYGLSRVTTCIYKIFRRKNIERLELLCDSFDNEGLILPWTLLDKVALNFLALCIPNCTFHVVSVNCFPNLKVFYLWDVNILNGNPESDTLILNFPVLELFQLTRCKWVDVKFVKIYAPVLKAFESATSPLEGPHDYSIQIISSSLSTFKCSDGFPENVILTGSQLVSACLVNDYEVSDLPGLSPLTSLISRVWKILDESPRLVELVLSKFMALKVMLGPSLHRHGELERLCLIGPSNTGILFTLIQNAPSLKYLSLNMLEWDQSNYNMMGLEPPCIKSHLEEVHLYFFEGRSSQFDFVKFLLMNCGGLKELVVYHPPCSENAWVE